jgi:hypothetical protein
MSTLRIFLLLAFLSGSALADANSLNASTLASSSAAGASVVAETPISAVPLPEPKRPLALWLGIALVLVTFQRGISRRQRA